MFAPPPTAALSRAEIDARLKAIERRSIHSPDSPTRGHSPASSIGERARSPSHSSRNEVSPALLSRTKGLFGSNKEREREPEKEKERRFRSLVSGPLPSSPPPAVKLPPTPSHGRPPAPPPGVKPPAPPPVFMRPLPLPPPAPPLPRSPPPVVPDGGRDGTAKLAGVPVQQPSLVERTPYWKFPLPPQRPPRPVDLPTINPRVPIALPPSQQSPSSSAERRPGRGPFSGDSSQREHYSRPVSRSRRHSKPDSPLGGMSTSPIDRALAELSIMNDEPIPIDGPSSNSAHLLSPTVTTRRSVSAHSADSPRVNSPSAIDSALTIRRPVSSQSGKHPHDEAPHAIGSDVTWHRPAKSQSAMSFQAPRQLTEPPLPMRRSTSAQFTTSKEAVSPKPTEFVVPMRRSTSEQSPLNFSFPVIKSSVQSGKIQKIQTKRTSGSGMGNLNKALPESPKSGKSPTSRRPRSGVRHAHKPSLEAAALGPGGTQDCVQVSPRSTMITGSSAGNSVRSIPASSKTPSRTAHAGAGETLDSLVKSGFFSSNGQPVIVNVITSAQGGQILPNNPTGIIAAPTDFYAGGRRASQVTTAQAQLSDSARGTPLKLVTNFSFKTKHTPDEPISPYRLTAIPEHVSLKDVPSPSSSATTPVATQIHLRNGSVVTVTPPEMNAWKQTLYIQGPIKLPAPGNTPKRDSVTAMDPIQQVINSVYQDAFGGLRRKSDDAAVDDVCDFFEQFGIEKVHYDGDVLAVQGADDLAAEVDEGDTIGGKDSFSTPPNSPPMDTPIDGPVESLVVKTAVKAKPHVTPFLDFDLPPIENEETLRARGIARLARRAKNAA